MLYPLSYGGIWGGWGGLFGGDRLHSIFVGPYVKNGGLQAF